MQIFREDFCRCGQKSDRFNGNGGNAALKPLSDDIRLKGQRHIDIRCRGNRRRKDGNPHVLELPHNVGRSSIYFAMTVR